MLPDLDNNNTAIIKEKRSGNLETKKAHLLTKEWAFTQKYLTIAGQPRYPSFPDRRFCVPLFQEVCLFSCTFSIGRKFRKL
mgnify:CR=1 FL=1